MDKTLFLKEADRMAALETNTALSPDKASSTKEYVYKKAAPVTARSPSEMRRGSLFRMRCSAPSESRACSVSCWVITRCAAVQTSK